MLVAKEIWIGERLRIKSSGQIGTFEGIVTDQIIKLKTAHQVIQIQLHQLELAEEEITDNSIFFDQDTELKKKDKTQNSIDLHIEILAPNLSNARPERILLQQLRSFEIFMQKAIHNKLPHLIIIHGKGEGILRTEIQLKLKQQFNAKIIQSINDDGATEVWM